MTFPIARLLVPLLIGLAAGAADAQSLGKADFQSALAGAMADRTPRNTPQGDQLAMEELQNVSPQGAFRVGVTSSCSLLGTSNSVSNEAGKLMRFRIPALFANVGDQYQFAMNSQVVAAHQREAVEKALNERLQTLKGDVRKLKAEIRRQDNGSYQLAAQYDYGGSPSAGAIRSSMAAILGNARFMTCDIHTAMELADQERWKALRNTKLGQLDRGSFITLYPLLKESGYEVQGSAPGGTWRFKMRDDQTTRVENFVNEFKVFVYAKPPSPPDAARMATIADNIRALPLSHGAVRIAPYDVNDRGFIWVALIFSYADMTGDQFTDTMKKLIDKRQILDVHKQVVKAIEAAY